MLNIDNLHAFYGKSHVLHGVSFNVKAGEIVALLGRNGSGRSTTAKAIMGLVDCQGDIKWKDKQIVGKKAFEIAHLGLGYVPENRDIFPKLTVHQNLLLGQKGKGKGARWTFEDMYQMFPRLWKGSTPRLGFCRVASNKCSPFAELSWAIPISSSLMSQQRVWRPRLWC